MSEWWQGIESIEKVYWIITLIGSLFFIFIMFMTFIGGEMDEIGDGDFDGGIDFQFLTLKNIIGFITIFGWSGLACIHSGWSPGITITVSFICGLIMMFAIAGLFYVLRNSGESGNLDLNNAIGVIGEVYLPIGASRSTIGKISIRVQGSLRELEALTDELEDLQRGNVIRVTKVVSDEILLVEKVTS